MVVCDLSLVMLKIVVNVVIFDARVRWVKVILVLMCSEVVNVMSFVECIVEMIERSIVMMLIVVLRLAGA